MLVLFPDHPRRAALAAKLVRRLAGDIRRPAAFMSGTLTVSVGVGEGIMFYRRDWNLFYAHASVDGRDKIDWFRHDEDFKPEMLTETLNDAINRLFGQRHAAVSPFFHWCSIRCWYEHVMFDRKR